MKTFQSSKLWRMNLKKNWFIRIKLCFLMNNTIFSKTFEGKSSTLFSHGDYVKEVDNGVNEVALIKEDEIKEKPNLDLRTNLFSQPREIDTRVSP